MPPASGAEGRSPCRGPCPCLAHAGPGAAGVGFRISGLRSSGLGLSVWKLERVQCAGACGNPIAPVFGKFRVLGLSAFRDCWPCIV